MADDCPDCDGTGIGPLPIALMPDVDLIPDECPTCDGAGSIRKPPHSLPDTAGASPPSSTRAYEERER